MKKQLLISLLCLMLNGGAVLWAQEEEGANGDVEGAAVDLFNEFAEPLTQHLRHLKVKNIDFSIESLDAVNQYLDKVRKKKMSEEERRLVCLRAGAYLGEVIRKNDQESLWNWYRYDDAMASNLGNIKQYADIMPTTLVLYSKEMGLLFPMAKVEKYMRRGKTENLRSYAERATHFGLSKKNMR